MVWYLTEQQNIHINLAYKQSMQVLTDKNWELQIWIFLEILQISSVLKHREQTTHFRRSMTTWLLLTGMIKTQKILISGLMLLKWMKNRQLQCERSTRLITVSLITKETQIQSLKTQAFSQKIYTIEKKA